MARWLSDRAKEAIRLRDVDADGECRCVYCLTACVLKANTNNPAAFSIDHIHARAEGGDLRNPQNLVVACFSCNNNKKTKDTAEWMQARLGAEGAAAAQARIEERLSRNAKWAEYVADAKARGFKA